MKDKLQNINGKCNAEEVMQQDEGKEHFEKWNKINWKL